MQGYLPLIQKDSVTLTHGFAVYIKERLPFAQDLSVENVEDFYLFSTGSTSFSLASFSFINHYLCLCAWFELLLCVLKIGFSQSNLLLMHLSFKSFMSLIRTD